MAAERQEERSDEKQAGLWVEKVVQLASAAGQADPPKVVFDKRKPLGLVAYHYPHTSWRWILTFWRSNERTCTAMKA